MRMWFDARLTADFLAYYPIEKLKRLKPSDSWLKHYDFLSVDTPDALKF